MAFPLVLRSTYDAEVERLTGEMSLLSEGKASAEDKLGAYENLLADSAKRLRIRRRKIVKLEAELAAALQTISNTPTEPKSEDVALPSAIGGTAQTRIQRVQHEASEHKKQRQGPK